MTEHLDPVLVAKWLAERLTVDERHTVERWLAVDPARHAELDELRELWHRAAERVDVRAAVPDAAVAERARWSAILRTIREQEAATRPQHTGRVIAFPLSQPSRALRRWLAVAATIALALGGGIWYATREVPSIAREFAAIAGTSRTVLLSDGSRVTLAPGSRLTFTDGHKSGSMRSATLDGQAFFAVAHDARRPFVVTTGEVTTRVLGTQFNVRAYRDGGLPVVTVRSGKVGVTTSRSEAVVLPGQEAVVDSVGRIRVAGIDVDRALAWTAGRLEFVGAEAATVVQDVNRWYGLRLQLTDTLLARHRMTVAFEHATADDAVATLTRLLGRDALVSLPLPDGRR